MKYPIVLLISLLIAAQGLFAQKETTISNDVRPVNSNIDINGYQLFYSLPKNFIRISINVKQVVQEPGPYAIWSEKYLNISDGVIQDELSYFELESAFLSRYSRPDSACQYAISYSGYGSFPALQLADNGVLMGCNLNYKVQDMTPIPEDKTVFNTEPAPIHFFDLGVIPFVEEKNETLYKMVQTDSTPQRVPYEKVSIEPTSEEHNAKEAADFIRKLRKRRLKLLIGLKDETFVVEGEAMQVMVDELNKLEQQYLELFVGKTVERKFVYSVDFEPDADVQAEQQVVGWFSQTHGFSAEKPDLRKSDFKPLTVSARSLGKLPEVSVQKMDNSGKSPIVIKYGLYYRIPAMVQVSLTYYEKELCTQKILIAQKGVVMPLPADYLNHAYGIEFNPELGALRQILKSRLE